MDVSPNPVTHVRDYAPSAGWHIAADPFGARTVCGETMPGSPLVWRGDGGPPPPTHFVCRACTAAVRSPRTFDPDVAERQLRHAARVHGCVDALGYGLQAVAEVRRLRALLEVPRVLSAVDADEGEG